MHKIAVLWAAVSEKLMFISYFLILFAKSPPPQITMTFLPTSALQNSMASSGNKLPPTLTTHSM